MLMCSYSNNGDLNIVLILHTKCTSAVSTYTTYCKFWKFKIFIGTFDPQKLMNIKCTNIFIHYIYGMYVLVQHLFCLCIYISYIPICTCVYTHTYTSCTKYPLPVSPLYTYICTIFYRLIAAATIKK